ncbi:hypothetical protein BpHYR1_036781 [Brachionus plicatilis]|uniref:Uncharacterized protein n=1 Tax=Brachionus plicatilis TaxID=10195 RepID=A0A3M7PS04_BRAPC|nr:hypothetical protein BpHYR1_036781 [Brachionus plicatilis]
MKAGLKPVAAEFRNRVWICVLLLERERIEANPKCTRFGLTKMSEQLIHWSLVNNAGHLLREQKIGEQENIKNFIIDHLRNKIFNCSNSKQKSLIYAKQSLEIPIDSNDATFKVASTKKKINAIQSSVQFVSRILLICSLNIFIVHQILIFIFFLN